MLRKWFQTFGFGEEGIYECTFNQVGNMWFLVENHFSNSIPNSIRTCIALNTAPRLLMMLSEEAGSSKILGMASYRIEPSKLQPSEEGLDSKDVQKVISFKSTGVRIRQKYLKF